MGDSGCFQEPIFIPRTAEAAEGDGYVVCLLNLIAEGRSELVVLDSTDMAAGPIARIKVPFRMRMSLHGWLTRISLRSFLVATGLGQLPATLIYSYAGEMLTGGARTFVYGLLILFSVSVLVYLIKRVYRGN